MILNRESGYWEPENEEEDLEYSSYMIETMGGRTRSEEELVAIEARAADILSWEWPEDQILPLRQIASVDIPALVSSSREERAERLRSESELAALRSEVLLLRQRIRVAEEDRDSALASSGRTILESQEWARRQNEQNEKAWASHLEEVATLRAENERLMALFGLIEEGPDGWSLSDISTLRAENERLRAEVERLKKLQWDTETEALQQIANRDLWKERFEYLRGQVLAFLSYDLDDPKERRRSINEMKVIL